MGVAALQNDTSASHYTTGRRIPNFDFAEKLFLPNADEAAKRQTVRDSLKKVLTDAQTAPKDTSDRLEKMRASKEAIMKKFVVDFEVLHQSGASVTRSAEEAKEKSLTLIDNLFKNIPVPERMVMISTVSARTSDILEGQNAESYAATKKQITDHVLVDHLESAQDKVRQAALTNGNAVLSLRLAHKKSSKRLAELAGNAQLKQDDVTAIQAFLDLQNKNFTAQQLAQ